MKETRLLRVIRVNLRLLDRETGWSKKTRKQKALILWLAFSVLMAMCEGPIVYEFLVFLNLTVSTVIGHKIGLFEDGK